MELIVLASASPQRQHFFRMLDLPFITMPADIDESFAGRAENPAVAGELAVQKIRKVQEALKDEPPRWIFGADTLVSLDGLIYGKPRGREDAARMLRAFQGRTHEVTSAAALYRGAAGTTDCRLVSSAVSFAPLTDGEIEWYLDSGEWCGAAGSYRIQGLASCFITSIKGSYSSIVGLPLREFYVMLRENYYPFGG